MNYQHAPEADGVTQARNLLAEAAQEVDRLEIEASQTFCQLTALTGMLARLDRLAVSHQPEIVEVALDAATVCREAEVLLRYIKSTLPNGEPFELPPTASVVERETVYLGDEPPAFGIVRPPA
jgi:hypothetical protein